LETTSNVAERFPALIVTELSPQQKALIKGYKTKYGIDLNKWLGVLSCHTTVQSPADGYLQPFAAAFTKEYDGKTVITLSEQATEDMPGTARETCYVFEGFMDYLSFLTLRLENCPKYPELDRQDYMVLNSVANVSKALYPLGSYERIHCFFDNDRAGMEALQQIRMEYGRDLYIRDASQTYSGCKDLNEYLQKQTERNRQVRSAKETHSRPPKKKNGFRL
jgi:hypothetical protein